MGRRLTAEALGTFWLVFAGCGSALLSGRPAAARHRGLRDRLRLRAGRGHGRLRRGPYLRLPYQSRRLHRPHGEQAVPGPRGPRLHCRPSDRGRSWGPGSSISLPAGGRGSSPAASPPTAMASIPRRAIRCWRASAPKWCSPSSSCSSFWGRRIAGRRRALRP